MKVYGASVSYYTGKLETYLRYKGISYERASPYQDVRRIKENVGSIQHPVVERDDGRWMSDILGQRPFLLGRSPSIADIGLMGPMLRHFGQDPTPADIMRDEAPAVFDWLGRMWNARQHASTTSFVAEVPADLNPLLQEIAETHLVQLTSNAMAYHAR